MSAASKRGELVPLAYDGFERMRAEELLSRHRNSTAVNGDLVRAIATLQEQIDELSRVVIRLQLHKQDAPA